MHFIHLDYWVLTWNRLNVYERKHWSSFFSLHILHNLFIHVKYSFKASTYREFVVYWSIFEQSFLKYAQKKNTEICVSIADFSHFVWRVRKRGCILKTIKYSCKIPKYLCQSSKRFDLMFKCDPEIQEWSLARLIRLFLGIIANNNEKIFQNRLSSGHWIWFRENSMCTIITNMQIIFLFLFLWKDNMLK